MTRTVTVRLCAYPRKLTYDYAYIRLHVNARCTTRYAVAVERELIMTNNPNIRFRHKYLQLAATFFSFSSITFKEATWRITGNRAHSFNLILFSSLDYTRVKPNKCTAIASSRDGRPFRHNRHRPRFTVQQPHDGKFIIIIILFAIKSMIYKTHGQKQYDRTTRHTNAPTVAHVLYKL